MGSFNLMKICNVWAEFFQLQQILEGGVCVKIYEYTFKFWLHAKVQKNRRAQAVVYM